MNICEAKTISVPIDRNWHDLYNEVWHPEAFPKWASGLSAASLERSGDEWTGKGPEGGSIAVTFTDRNCYGVMDHWVRLEGGKVVYIPLRIVENGEGSEVLLTLFRQPDMTDAKFNEDAKWVLRDLQALKALAER